MGLSYRLPTARESAECVPAFRYCLCFVLLAGDAGSLQETDIPEDLSTSVLKMPRLKVGPRVER